MKGFIVRKTVEFFLIAGTRPDDPVGRGCWLPGSGNFLPAPRFDLPAFGFWLPAPDFWLPSSVIFLFSFFFIFLFSFSLPPPFGVPIAIGRGGLLHFYQFWSRINSYCCCYRQTVVAVAIGHRIGNGVHPWLEGHAIAPQQYIHWVICHSILIG